MLAGPGGAEVGRVSVRVVPDTSKFRRELYAELRRLKNKAVVKVKVEPDLKGFRTKLAAQLKSLSTNAAVKVRVDVDHAGARDQLNRHIGDLQKSAKNIKISADVDYKPLQRAAASMTQLGGGADAASTSFMGLSRVGAIVAAVFAAIAPAVGLVAGLLLGLPSLIASFAVGAGAIALGMDGIKAAASRLTPQFESLKAAVSGVFESRMGPIFDQLGTLFPILEQGMTRVAGGLSDMMQGFTDVVTSSTGMTKITAILDGTAGLFHELKPVVASFTSSFLTLAAEGAKSFGHLLVPIQNFASSWGEMVNRITSNGTFDGAMQGLSQTLDGIFSLFTRLVDVGATAMASLGGPLQNMLGGFGDLLVAAMPALTSFAGGVANVIGALGTSLAPAFAALTPAVDAIMPVITQLASTLGGALAQAVTALAPGLAALAQVLGPVITQAVTALAPILAQLASTLGTVLLQAVTALAPVMPQISAAFAQLAAALGQGLATVLPVLVQAFAALLPTIVQLVPAFLQIVQAVIPLIPAAAQIATALLQIATAAAPLVNALAQVVAFAAQVIAKVVEMAAAIITSGVEPFQQMASAAAEAFGQLVSTISEGIAQAISFLQALPGQAKAAMGDLGSLLVASGKALINGFISGIKSMVGAAVDAASSVVSAVRNLFPFSPAKTGPFSGSGWVDKSGESVITAFAAGMVSQKTAVVDAASGVLAGVQETLNKGVTFEGITVDSTSTDAELKQLKDLLDLRTKELAVSKDQAPDKAAKAAITARMQEMNAIKRQISLQREQLDYQQKYSAEVESTTSDYDSQINSMAKMPYDFAKANADQFMSDLGIGGGALTGLGNAAIDYGSQFIFNVSGIGEALTAQKTVQNQQAVAATGR